jgi:hypothetical protein
MTINFFEDQEFCAWQNEDKIEYPAIELPSHKCAKTSLHLILEELYESNSILDTDLLLHNFACLCDEFGISDDILRSKITVKRNVDNRHDIFSLGLELSKIYS